MPKDFPRHERVGDQIQRELASLISKEVKDPRLSPMVTIAEVRVSSDLSHAKVYFTVLDDQGERSAEVLNRAAGFLRSQLCKLLRLRIVPTLRFYYDTTSESGQKLSSLIDQAVASDREKSGE